MGAKFYLEESQNFTYAISCRILRPGEWIFLMHHGKPRARFSPRPHSRKEGLETRDYKGYKDIIRNCHQILLLILSEFKRIN